MNNPFSIELAGKKKITSHLTLCAGCNQLRLLSSYITTRVAMFFSLPILPLGKLRKLDECPTCGHCGQVKARQYYKNRKKNLSVMMQGFTRAAEDPENCCLALQTLMIYDEASWFEDVQKTYGKRFESNQEVQLLIARGLCRFGEYERAIEYCRKSIALNGGKKAEELLEFCLAALVATKHSLDLEQWIVKEESARTAYIPILVFAAAMMIFFTMQGVSAVRTNRAWIVNGSLRKYDFILDGERHILRPGSYQQIKLKLGEHVLEFGSDPAHHFTYSLPLIKQLLDKQMLVINPDATALLAIADTDEATDKTETTFSFGEQVRILDGLRQPMRGIRKVDADATNADTIYLYRPETHMAMVQLLKSFGLDREAIDYARLALADDPATDESVELLDFALDQADDADTVTFLQIGLSATPALLPWHLYYQNYMMIHHPEYNLERDYTLRCKDLPDEAEAYYLLGRVLRNREAAYKFFEHSETLPRMEGEGYQAIARSLFVRGQFAEAQPYSQKAVTSNTTNTVFLNLNEQLHMALRQYDELIAYIKSAPPSLSKKERARRNILYLTCAGYHREAEAEAVRLSEQQVETLPALNAIRFYAVGNIAEYLSCIAETETEYARMEKLLHNNRIEEADRLLSQNDNQPYWQYLVFYCAAMNQGLPGIAGTNLEKAVSKAGHETLSRHRIATLLSDSSPPTVDELRDLDMDAQEKAVLCVSMGYRFPELQPALNAMAEKYNFNRTYPQLLLKKWMRSSLSTADQPENPSAEEIVKPEV